MVEFLRDYFHGKDIKVTPTLCTWKVSGRFPPVAPSREGLQDFVERGGSFGGFPPSVSPASVGLEDEEPSWVCAWCVAVPRPRWSPLSGFTTRPELCVRAGGWRISTQCLGEVLEARRAISSRLRGPSAMATRSDSRPAKSLKRRHDATADSALPSFVSRSGRRLRPRRPILPAATPPAPLVPTGPRH